MPEGGTNWCNDLLGIACLECHYILKSLMFLYGEGKKIYCYIHIDQVPLRVTNSVQGS